MKKTAKLLIVLSVIVALSACLFACTDNVDTSGNMTLVILDGDNAKEYSVDLSNIPSGENKSSGLFAVLDYLKDKGELTYTANPDGFLTQVNDIKPSGNVYIYLYTDVEKDINVGAYATTIEYKNKTYTDSISGAKDMTIKDGCTIIITTIVFG